MTIVLIIAGALTALILAVFIVTCFLSSSIHFSRSTIIKAPVEKVFKQVNNLRSWHLWAPFRLNNNNMHIHYGLRESGEGADCSWHSRRRTSVSKLIITKSNPFHSISAKIQLFRRRKIKEVFHFQQEGDCTRLTCETITETGANPLRKLRAYLQLNRISRQMDCGLLLLKELTEKDAFAY